MVSSCIWEYPEALPPRGNGGEATIFARSAAGLENPDIQLLQVQFPVVTDELATRQPVPAGSWGKAGTSAGGSRKASYVRK